MRMSPASEQRQQIGDGLVHDGRRNHQPDRARLFAASCTKSRAKRLPPPSPLTSSSTAFGDTVEDDALVAALHQPPHHVRAHSPRPIIPSCIVDLLHNGFSGSSILRRLGSSALSKMSDKFPVARGDLGYRVFARDLLRPPGDQGIPETVRPTAKPMNPGTAGRRREPFTHLCVVLAPAQDDAAHFIPATAARSGHDLHAVLAAVQALDLPDVRLNTRVLKLLDGLRPSSRGAARGHRPSCRRRRCSSCAFSGGTRSSNMNRLLTLAVQIVGQPLQAPPGATFSSCRPPGCSAPAPCRRSG